MKQKYIVVLIMSVVLIILAGYIFNRPVISFYFTIRAEQMLGRAWSNPEWIPCENSFQLSGENQKHALLASSIAENALRYNPENTHAILVLGRASCFSRNFQKAITVYQQYVQLEDNNPLAWLELGFALQAIHNLPEAVEAWLLSESKVDHFAETGEQLVEINEAENASIWFLRALALDPTSKRAIVGLESLGTYQGDLQNLENLYYTAFLGGQEKAVMPLINLYHQLGKDTDLIEVLYEALSTFQTSAERENWWKELGHILEDTADYSAAAKIYQQALIEYPQDLLLLAGYARSLYYANDDIDFAINIIDEAISNSSTPGYLYYLGGDLFTKAGRLKQADSYFAKAIETNPNVTFWYIRRARNALRINNSSIAFQTLTDLIQKHPNNETGYLELANLYFNEGKLEQAAHTIDLGMENITPKSVDFYLLGGQIHSTIGRTRDAVLMYKNALKIDPDNIEAQNLLDALQTH